MATEAWARLQATFLPDRELQWSALLTRLMCSVHTHPSRAGNRGGAGLQVSVQWGRRGVRAQGHAAILTDIGTLRQEVIT